MAENNARLSITVDDGARRVPIVNTQGEEIGAFTFRPTDIGIIERFNRLAERFEQVTEPLAGVELDESGAAGDERQLAALKAAEARLYDAVNELFGGDMAGAFFGKMHPFSPVDGAFYCEIALKAVGEFINARFNTETKRFSDRARQYLRHKA